MANKVIYFDWVNQRRVLTDGSIDDSPLNLYYNELPNWEIHVVTAAGSTLTAVDMTDAVDFRAAVSDDFNPLTDPWVRVLNASITSTGKATGVIVIPVDTFTAEFLAGIGTQERKNAYFDFGGFNSGGRRIFYGRFDIIAKGVLDPVGGTPPATPQSYDLKADKVGAVDIEITDPTKGYILPDRTTAIRYRLYVDNGVFGMESV